MSSVSDAVIVGFTAGAGLLIFFNQLRNLLRLDFASVPGLWGTLENLAMHISEVHIPSMLLGLLTILVILLLRRFKPSMPGPLISIALAAILTWVLNLEPNGVQVVGELPRGLPPFSPLPIFDFKLMGQLATGALAIAAIGLVEAMSIARSVSTQTGQRLDTNQEFIGQGLANIACGFFSGYACSGSFSRTAINHQAGAKTAISNVFGGLIVLLVMLLFGWVGAFIPLPALAGIVTLVAFGLIDKKGMAQIWQGARGDRVIMVTTLVATLAIPIQYAALVGILMSLAYYLLKTSMPRVRTVVPDGNFQFFIRKGKRPSCPQLGVMEILGDMYFGASQACLLE